MKLRTTLELDLEGDRGQPCTENQIAAVVKAVKDAIHTRMIGPGFLPDDVFLREYGIDARVAEGEQGPHPYVATFVSDAGWTTFIFRAETTQAALQQARDCDRQRDLHLDHYGTPTATLQILIADASGVEREVWNSYQLRLRRAALALLAALDSFSTAWGRLNRAARCG